MAHESREEYRVIAQIEARRLTEPFGLKPIHQGKPGLCPRCERAGRFDFEIGYSYPNENAIYWSTVHDAWRCQECDTLEGLLGETGRIIFEEIERLKNGSRNL